MRTEKKEISFSTRRATGTGNLKIWGGGTQKVKDDRIATQKLLNHPDKNNGLNI